MEILFDAPGETKKTGQHHVSAILHRMWIRIFGMGGCTQIRWGIQASMVCCWKLTVWTRSLMASTERTTAALYDTADTRRCR